MVFRKYYLLSKFYIPIEGISQAFGTFFYTKNIKKKIRHRPYNKESSKQVNKYKFKNKEDIFTQVHYTFFYKNREK